MPEPSFRRASARRLLSITACVAAVAGLSLTAVSASAAEPNTAIPNSKPSWVAKATKVGTPAGTATTSVRVYLAPKGGLAALKADALAVSTPGSATYGHFITPAQYRARYAPSAATVHSVEAYLRAAGLKVTGVEASNRYISLTGDVAAAQKAFHTTIGRFKHNGKTVQAPTAALSLPSSISSLVSTVTGLDTTPRLVKPTAPTPVSPGAGFRNARPCSTDYGQVAAKYQADFKTPLPKFHGKTLPYAVCGYTGPQLRAAYEGATALDGSGVTVAITDAYASPTIAKDANRYATEHGDGAYTSGQLTQVTPPANKYTDLAACGASGWFGEQTLDVEAVHAMAPAAKIRYYGGTSCQDSDLLTTLAKVVDDNKASLVSNSWGDVAEAQSADAINAYEQVFLQGSMQGISFMFSSGDNGDELANTGIKQVDYPTSDPYVTSVGGTSTAIGAGGKLLGQTGWGTDKYSLSADGKSWSFVGYSYGAGGGTSTLFNKPSYQTGVGGGSRQVPDVALDADPTTGMLVGQTQTFSDGVYYDEYRIGGTSLASPLFAGMTALTLQSAGHRAGLLNPKVYQTRSAFTDVTGNPLDAGNVRVDFANGENADNGLLYSVRTFDQDSSLVVKPGYDQVTGVGVPNTKWLTALK
ncbi:MAG TPA: S53 family peptidase [Amnibacterium sp.]|uniref:S53 family peptidase n=1 Tax=Amnibacterium sp. TaxID=1872496 RepID=UPI002F95445F